jgi:uncharacterized protein DUF4231
MPLPSHRVSQTFVTARPLADYQEAWLTRRLAARIEWYGAQASKNRALYFGFRVLSVVAASAITVIAVLGWTPVGWQPTWLPGLLGAAVVLVESIDGVYHPRDRWLTLRATEESLKRERSLFLAGAGPYVLNTPEDASDAAFQVLVVRSEEIMATENTVWRREFERTGKHETRPGPGT